MRQASTCGRVLAPLHCWVQNGILRFGELWTYDSDNFIQIKCLIPVELVLFELR